MLKKEFLLILLSFTLLSCAKNQSSSISSTQESTESIEEILFFTLTGTLVQQSNQNPISNQQLILQNESNEDKYNTTTNNNGEFEFTNIAKGTYSLNLRNENVNSVYYFYKIDNNQINISGYSEIISLGTIYAILDEASLGPIH